jgi:hypothetical protein
MTMAFLTSCMQQATFHLDSFPLSRPDDTCARIPSRGLSSSLSPPRCSPPSHPSIIHTSQALAAVPSPDPLPFLIHAPTETSPVLRATPSTNRATPPQPAGNQESSALPSPSTSAFSHSWGAIRGSHHVSSALIDVCAGRASRRCWEGGVGWVWD